MLAESSAIRGVGQSSWGPAVYGVTDISSADKAITAAEDALAEIDTNGRVLLVEPRNDGARINRSRD